MRRGYVRGTSRHSAKDQHAALDRAGVTDRYEEGNGYEDIDAAIKGLRAGDEIVVTHAARLARHRRQLEAIIKRIHKRGGVIVETETGRRSDDRDQCVEMIFAALTGILGDARSPQMKKLGQRSGEARRLKAIEARMPVEEASRVWHNNSDWSTQQCLDHMPGWSQKAAYQELGRRGLAKGRPRKKTR